jgi:hypothetical protein
MIAGNAGGEIGRLIAAFCFQVAIGNLILYLLTLPVSAMLA